MYTIKVISSASKVKGQGVGSCYEEQVRLIKGGLQGKFAVHDVHDAREARDNRDVHDVRSTHDVRDTRNVHDVRDNRDVRSACGAQGEDSTSPRRPRPRAADINHYHTIDPANLISNLCKGHRTVSVGYVHFLPETVDGSLRMPATVRKLFNSYLILFYKSMDYLVTVNPSFVGKLEQFGVDPARIAYIPNFVSCDGFCELGADEIAQARRSVGVGPGEFVALGVGQLQTRKGVADFVEVARMLPDVTFLWAGGFSFGVITSGYEKMRELVADPPPNVRFLGIVDRSEMNKVYNACDALFLPSYSELFPMAVLEAMCCKKPLLLRDIDAYTQILYDGYIKGKSNEDFAEALRRLARDPAFYSEWQSRSWTCHEQYAEESVLRMWEAFYTSVLESRKTKTDGRLFAPWKNRQATE